MHTTVHNSALDTSLPYICNLCPFRSTELLTLLAHMRGHPGKNQLKWYTCPNCCTNTIDKTSILSHIRKEHRDERCQYHLISAAINKNQKPPACVVCGAVFTLYYRLLAHLKKNHGYAGIFTALEMGTLLFDDHECLRCAVDECEEDQTNWDNTNSEYAMVLDRVVKDLTYDKLFSRVRKRQPRPNESSAVSDVNAHR